MGELEVGGSFTQFPSSSPPKYIAVNGMRSLADSLLLGVVAAKKRVFLLFFL